MNAFYCHTYESPVGTIVIQSDGTAITHLSFSTPNKEKLSPCAITEEAVKQLDEYFKGQRFLFDLPLAPAGTDFQKKVWHELQAIQYGETTSYKNIAIATGDAKNVRAIGTANGKNPIAIVIPCHRIIGSNGQLTGYAGGLWRKRWLLLHEQKNSTNPTTLF